MEQGRTYISLLSLARLTAPATPAMVPPSTMPAWVQPSDHGTHFPMGFLLKVLEESFYC